LTDVVVFSALAAQRLRQLHVMADTILESVIVEMSCGCMYVTLYTLNADAAA
jgi:hypothetical protein